MSGLKRLVLLLVTGTTGLLLTLSGLGQIELSRSLVLYSGIALLVLTVLIYIYSKLTGLKNSKKPKEVLQ